MKIVDVTPKSATLPPSVIAHIDTSELTGLVGSALPRVAPPMPQYSQVAEYRATSAEMGITPMPWQEVAARYVTALSTDQARYLYREIAILVARQNGKTTLAKPLIVRALRQGRRILHLAQTRELPRHMFGVVADWFERHEPHQFPLRRGRPVLPRFGVGQEEIILANGGTYRIVAANRGSARGHSVDLVIVDELREMRDFEIMAAVEPTLTMSPDPQLVYLSNMGDEDSVVLNTLRDRAMAGDPSLAYLEWSAAPELPADDRTGWAQANPAIGHYPGVLDALERAYVAAVAAGTLPYFEVERLCRSVVSLREALVTTTAWNTCEGEIGEPVAPVMGVSLDPEGRRASAVLAWRAHTGEIALTQLYDVPGAPVNVDQLGRDLRAEARVRGVVVAGHNPATDTQLARHLPRVEPISGRALANASARFAELVESGRLRWHDAAPVGADLSWSVRKPHDTGFVVARASDDRPITALLAAVSAAWLASRPPRLETRQPHSGALAF